MIAQGGGAHIVNTASGAGLFGIPGMAPYCASKFAVVGLSESLSVELSQQGIRVTAVCPGIIRTRIVNDGRIGLLGKGGKGKAERFYERFGASAPSVARDVLSAVHRGRSVQLSPLHVWGPFLLKRFSTQLYQLAARRLVPRLLGR